VIAIRGEAMEGKAAIIVDNDGAAYADNPAGFGLINMRQRVAQLGGEIRIAPFASGTRVIMLLPLALPDVQTG
jgi:signal transduction histidine kinase